MDQDKKNFIPLPGDSQAERPTTPPGSPSEAQLTQDLQAMYSLEKSASIAHVWTRLVRQRAGIHGAVVANQLPEEANLQTQDYNYERNPRMTQKIIPLTPQKSLPRFFSLLAAALVCVVVVGSMALILNVVRNNSPIPSTGSHSAGKVHTPTPTAILSPECRDTQDAAEEKLCLEHAEKILNITKTFGTHKVTFVRAYADTTQLRLIYTTTDSPHSDAISFMSVKIQQGITLGGGAIRSFTNPKTQEVYYVVYFDTKNIPAGTTELHVQSIVDAFSGQDTPLNFMLPVHTT